MAQADSMNGETGRSALRSTLATWVESLARSFQARPALLYAMVIAVFFLSRWALTPGVAAWSASHEVHLLILATMISTALNVAGIAVIALPFQALHPGTVRAPKVLTYEYWLDIVYWNQGWMLQVVGVAAVVLALDKWLWQWAPGPWLPFLSSWPSWLQVLIAVWLYDLVVYWRHRSEHEFSALWSFHAVHHSATQVDVLTTLRLHPLEIVYATLTGSAVLLVGFDSDATITAYAIYTGWNYFIHTNVRFRFGGIAKYMLVSPFMHHWHHAHDQAAIGKNVGVVFAWNDWLFGTAYHPDHWPERFGLNVPDELSIQQIYWRQLLYPLTYARAKLRAPKGARMDPNAASVGSLARRDPPRRPEAEVR